MSKKTFNEILIEASVVIGKGLMYLLSLMVAITGINFIINPLFGPWSDNNYPIGSLIGFGLVGIIFIGLGVWIFRKTYTENKEENTSDLSAPFEEEME